MNLETPEREVREIVVLYSRAEKLLRRELTTIGISSYKEVNALRASDHVAKIVKELNQRTARWTQMAMKSAYRTRSEQSKITLSILGFKKKAHISPIAQINAERRFIESTVAYFTRATGSIKRSADLLLNLSRSSNRLIKSIQEFDEGEYAFAEELFTQWAKEAVIAGWSRKRLSDMIENYLSGFIDDEGLINIRGRNFALGGYAELVARTQLRSAQSDATISTCNEYGCDLVLFSSHANPCEICAPLEGQVYSISGTARDYPMLTDEETPPIHPRCEHSISPTSEIAIEYRETHG